MIKEYQALENLKNKSSVVDKAEAAQFLANYIDKNNKLLSRLGLIYGLVKDRKKELENEFYNINKSMSADKLVTLAKELEEVERVVRILKLIALQYDNAELHGLKED